MLLKYRPEDKAAKKERLLKRAQAENEGKTVEAKKPIVVKYGLNHVTYLIEQVWTPICFFASLSDSRVLPFATKLCCLHFFLFAEQGPAGCHDVDPIELVVWLPAL
jgi:large subunit ribosomal protein L7Ae